MSNIQIDWNDNKQVVCAAIPGAYVAEHQVFWSKVYAPDGSDLGFAGTDDAEAWKLAREHSRVQAFEQEYKPAQKEREQVGIDAKIEIRMYSGMPVHGVSAEGRFIPFGQPENAEEAYFLLKSGKFRLSDYLSKPLEECPYLCDPIAHGDPLAERLATALRKFQYPSSTGRGQRSLLDHHVTALTSYLVGFIYAEAKSIAHAEKEQA